MGSSFNVNWFQFSALLHPFISAACSSIDKSNPVIVIGLFADKLSAKSPITITGFDLSMLEHTTLIMGCGGEVEPVNIEAGPHALWLKKDSKQYTWSCCHLIVVVCLVPLEIPKHFRVDPSKPVTDKTADFLWDAVNTGPWRMQGFFRGYKVSSQSSQAGSCITVCHV